MSLREIFISMTLFCSGYYSKSILSGDVTVGGLFQIQLENEVNGNCDRIAPLSVKGLEAVKWIFRKLNEANYIPGVNIGLDVWPTCGTTSRAIDHTVDMLLRIREERTNLSSIPLVGLIGPEYSSEARMVSYMLSTQRSEDKVLQVGFSTTAASLSDSNIYNNFVRVVPSDAVQSKVMVALMKELQWNYIAIIYDNDIYGIEGKDGLATQAAANSICIAKNVSLLAGPLNLSNLQQTLRDIITNTESPIHGVVVFASDSHVNSIMSAATSLKNVITDPLSFILSEAVGLSDIFFKTSNGVLYSAAKGVYAVNPPRLYVNEFETYWKNMFKNVSAVVEESHSNPWLRNVYSHYSGGCLPSNDPETPGCINLGQSQLTAVGEKSSWTSYAMKAAYVVAKSLNDIHSRLCSGGISGICSSLKNAIHEDRGSILTRFRNDRSPINFKQDFPFSPAEFANISVTFKGYNEVQHWEGFPEYEVHQYRKCISDNSKFCFEELGIYYESTLPIDKSVIREYHTDPNGVTWPDINYAQCQEGRICRSCITVDKAEVIYFKDGDLIVGGIVPVFDAGTDSPVSCGTIRNKNGNEMIQAFEYMVSLVNRNTVPYDKLFPGKSVGLMFINSCDQPLLMKQKLLNLFHEGVFVRNGKTINLREKLIGFAGPYSSSLSVATSSIFSDFGYVQVAFASTATDLSDREKYPYYTRVSTPDSKQAKAMISIIKHKFYSSSYIQIVYSKGTYGEAGRDAIKKEAEVGKVCIIQEIEVDENSNFNIVLPKLRSRPFAKIVILFLRAHQIDLIAPSMNRDMEYGEFMFIGSEEWGYRPDAFTDKQKLVGSIILSLQLPENKDFTKYLQGITISTKSDNPWLQEYIAAKYSCHIALSYDKTFTTACHPDMRLANNDTYEQEIWTPFALRAMTALLGGTSEAFEDLCGSSSPKICEPYRNNPLTVRNKIINQKINNETGNNVRVFDNNGDGIVGYTIYNLQRNPDNANKVIYKQVGTFSIDGQGFSLDQQNIVLPDGIDLPSVCPNVRECTLCRGPRPNVTTTGERESGSAAVSALGAVVGVLVVVLLLVVVIAVILYRRMKVSESKKDNYNYLTPVNVPDPNFYQARNVAYIHEETNHGTSRNNCVNSSRSQPPIMDPYLDPIDAYTSDSHDGQSNQSNTVPKKIDSISSISSMEKDDGLSFHCGSDQHPGSSDGSITKQKQINSLSDSTPQGGAQDDRNVSTLQDGIRRDGSTSSASHPSLSSSSHSQTGQPKFDRNISEHNSFARDGSPPLAPSRRPQQVAVVSAVPKS